MNNTATKATAITFGFMVLFYVTTMAQTTVEKADQPNQNIIFPKGEKISSDHYTGTVWVHMMVSNNDHLDCTVGNVTFEPDARTNWHKHPGGQILLVTEGRGYQQIKG